MNKEWLLETADTPIQRIFSESNVSTELLLRNDEVSAWLSRLSERSDTNNIGDIHGSHDYRMENILGKCWILGLSKHIKPFADNIDFILHYLNEHIKIAPSDEPSFAGYIIIAITKR